jgi:transcriptional regulator with XRE-family HTH domain
MSEYDDYNDSEHYPTYYSLTESGQPVLDGQLILDRQKRLELFIKENTPTWRITGQQHRFLRESMHISHYELAKCLGLSPSVILAFEEGQPVQRPRFVEGAYRAALTSVFYSYYYSRNKSYPKNSYPTFTLVNLVVNLYCYEEISLKTLQELVDIFNFRVKFQEGGVINILDEFGNFLFSVYCKEAV